MERRLAVEEQSVPVQKLAIHDLVLCVVEELACQGVALGVRGALQEDLAAVFFDEVGAWVDVRAVSYQASEVVYVDFGDAFRKH